jgi:hypothetical protein
MNSTGRSSTLRTSTRSPRSLATVDSSAPAQRLRGAVPPALPCLRSAAEPQRRDHEVRGGQRRGEARSSYWCRGKTAGSGAGPGSGRFPTPVAWAGDPTAGTSRGAGKHLAAGSAAGGLQLGWKPPLLEHVFEQVKLTAILSAGSTPTHRRPAQPQESTAAWGKGGPKSLPEQSVRA